MGAHFTKVVAAAAASGAPCNKKVAMRRMVQALSSSDMLCVAVRLYDHARPRFRASYTTRCNGLSMVPNRNGGDGQFDRVDLFIPASAFMQMAATLRTRRPGWKLNNVGEKEMFAADAGVPTAWRILRCMCFTESCAKARNVVRLQRDVCANYES